MAKKRKQRRNPIAELDFHQEMELVIGSGGPSCFESELQKRAAWFAHRERLLEEGFGSDSPGTRPDAWWLFERNMQPPTPGVLNLEREPASWEQLLQMGEMDSVEKGAVLAGWLEMRELRSLEVDNLKVLKRQARLLAEKVAGGQVALETLKKMEAKADETKEAEADI